MTREYKEGFLVTPNDAYIGEFCRNLFRSSFFQSIRGKVFQVRSTEENFPLSGIVVEDLHTKELILDPSWNNNLFAWNPSCWLPVRFLLFPIKRFKV